MNTDTRKKLLDLITEYGNCLTRIDGEKDLMKLIETQAVTECCVTAGAFKAVAAAHHKDQAKAVMDELNGKIDLFNEVRGLQDYAAMFRDGVVTVERDAA